MVWDLLRFMRPPQPRILLVPVSGSLVGSGLQLIRRSMVTSPDGANRVYRTEGERFERRLDDFRVADADGRV
ncbi:MAG: hypothetical protein VX975_04805 [Acidobacteriota bacterium]|nr:hypothetical protein [Acidobacteriota bacterium]